MQQPQSRVIVVMRHAQAEDTAASDFERRLTDRGRRDAQAAGQWLRAHGTVVDHALVSAAARASETWARLAHGAGWELTPDLDRGLYSAGPESALDLVRAVPDEVSTLLLLGHNPTVALLAQLLDDGEGDAEAGNQLAMGYPTGAISVFRLEGPWADLGSGSASLTAFHVPRG
ncbi:SixA phosphatase family protein [Nocardioides ferulae]|uniref:SixA phosphatase family protein n=1 Tax=Nocardioides ferulae TaxID=2340821 RepID=UPI001F0BEE6D|nr:histidine phosphatase family protein [Nocardioides ferulae]